MSANPRPEIDELLQQALGTAADERPSFIDRLCGDDASLRADLQGLLAAHEQAGDFLDQPAVTVDAPGSALTEGPGTVIDRYKILQQIGEGGFGVVYMAEQKEPVKRRVALKIIKLGMDTRQVIARFEAERQALALMDHPNIARVLDAGATETGRPYFVMELVKGVPITEYCDKNKLSLRERLRLFQQVCHAIQHAHQKGIIHRDLKPSNVLVTLHDGKPVPKVIDFGIAKATTRELTEKTIFTEFRQLIGTPEYMSPEQAEMSGLDIDTRSDVYSLGVLLYELLTGATPFDAHELRGAGYAEIQRIISEKQPAKPSTRVSTLASIDDIAAHRQSEPRKLGLLMRGDLDWIVMKAMEKDRTRRYETANGLAVDIQRYLDDEPVVAGPPSAAYRLRKFVHRNRRGVALASLVSVFLVIGSVVAVLGVLEGAAGRQIKAWYDQYDRWVRQPNRSIAILPPQTRAGDMELAEISSIIAQSVINRLKSSDGTRVVSFESVQMTQELKRTPAQVASEYDTQLVVAGTLSRVPGGIVLTLELAFPREGLSRWVEIPLVSSDTSPSGHGALDGASLVVEQEFRALEFSELPPGGTRNKKALSKYQTAIHILHGADETRLDRALQLFNEAIELDKKFALAYLGSAQAWLMKASLGTMPAESNEPALIAVNKAIELEPELAGAYAVLGQINFMYQWDWEEGWKNLNRALELDPELPEAHAYLGTYYATVGEFDKAVEHIKTAISIDETTLLRHESIIYTPFFTQRMDVAIGICEQALRLDPDYWSSHAWLGLALAWNGDLDGAIEHGEEAYRLEDNNPIALALLASVYAMKGQSEPGGQWTIMARDKLEELIRFQQSEYVCPYEIATVFLALGDKQAAIEYLGMTYDYLEETYNYLEMAVISRSECIPFYYSDVRMRELWGKPESEQIMAEVPHPTRIGITPWLD